MLYALLAAQLIVVDGGPIVQTPLGSIEGVQEGLVNVFRGIPYAESPGRFEVAQSKVAWTNTLNATVFGDSCAMDTGFSGLYSSSEDCLFANVWTPVGAQGLPVVVFVHGGGFIIRSGAYPKVWGDEFVGAGQDNSVVYVTMNYRLGIFGFFSSDETGANFGIKDQQTALRWVQDNIQAFGGNPQEVTLMGQSAGAMSVYAHLTSPGSRGLFQRAFLASTVGLHYRNLEENAELVTSLAHSVGCFFHDSLVSCLRSRPTAMLVAASFAQTVFQFGDSCPGCENILPWLPVVDNDVLTQTPMSSIQSGTYDPVPTVLSTVRNETKAFLSDKVRWALNNQLSYSALMSVLFGNNAEDFEDFYASASDTASMNFFTRLATASTDALFTCYIKYNARLMVQYAPTYLSYFMHAPSSHADPTNAKIDSQCEDGATCHASDLSFMFPASSHMRQLLGFSYGSEAESAFASSYAAAIRAFAHGDASDWVPYSADTGVAWDVQGASELVGYHADSCSMMEAHGLPSGQWDSPRSVV